MGTIDLTIRQGDTFAQTIACVNDDGTPMDLTDALATAYIRRGSAVQYPTPSALFDCNVADAPNGMMSVGMSADKTTALCPGWFYVWSLLVTLQDGTLKTAASGSVRVLPAITTPTYVAPQDADAQRDDELLSR